MACGVPVVATRVGAVDELVDDGSTGILVPPADARAIAAALGELLADSERRQEMGAAARRAALGSFGLSELAERHRRGYEIAMQRGRERARRSRASRSDTALAREREFFDQDAARRRPEEMPPREYAPFESRFEDALLQAAGDVRGKRVLDLGCGTGDLALRLLARGASVVALDLSPGSVEVARRRVRHFLPEAEDRCEFAVARAEDTGLESGSVDLVLGKWILHHVDLEQAAPEIGRVLPPGGEAVFVETSGLNPLLSLARRRLAGRAGIARYGTPDERPLTKEDLAVISASFSRCEIDYPVPVLLFLLERHVLKWRWPRVGRALASADEWLSAHVPRADALSYYLRVKLYA
jgi:SAM-dependent methyltransferase